MEWSNEKNLMTTLTSRKGAFQSGNWQQGWPEGYVHHRRGIVLRRYVVNVSISIFAFLGRKIPLE